MKFYQAVVFAMLLGITNLSYADEAQQKEEPAKKDPQTTVSGIYDKPFVTRLGRGAALGGYFATNFKSLFGTSSDETYFDVIRFVPFIYAEVSQRVHVGAEIEFEHGGFVAGDPAEATDGEIKLEFATLDVTFAEWMKFRAGLILSPLGRFNLVHDDPVNELTDRPLVNRLVIPTTLSEAGLGFFGTFYPSEKDVVSYELYVVNGFDGDTVSGTDVDLREGRGSAATDNNQDKSIVGRVAYSPMLGLELGFSGHSGVFSDTGGDSLMIGAADVTWTRGSWEVLAEAAHAWVEGAANKQGIYAQGGYRFLHGLVSIWPESYFTGLVRYDVVDEDRSQSGGTVDRVTLGVNFRPTQETAFKVDYAFLGSTPPGGSGRTNDGGQLALSFATFF